MTLSQTPYKGTRDFYPEDLRARDYIFKVWENVVKKYGYEKYDAPLIEPIELYQAKTSEEIVSEQTFFFTDRGGRQVTIRPEMTPTVSRMVAARRQDFAYPLRLYSIPNLWRYERPQRGRLREHWQLNVDLFGIDNATADHEVISVADSIMQKFGAKRSMYDIKVNSRELVTYLFKDYLKLDQATATTIIRLIDKKDKMDYAKFVAFVSASITPTQREQHKTDEKILALLNIKDINDLPKEAKVQPSAVRLLEIIETLQAQGVSNVKFDITLMRGFDYYTDVIFEIFDTHPENNRSLFGGGRYDGLVGAFGVEPLPTVGFGMGDVAMKIFLESHKLLPELPTNVHVTMVLIGDIYAKALPLITKLRAEGVHLSVDSSDRKLDKKLKNVNKSGVKYAIIMGDGELANESITLKDMQTGEQNKHVLERVVSKVMATPNDDFDG